MTTHEDRHEPAAVDRPRSRRSTTRILDRIKAIGFDSVEVPIFKTADREPYERLGKRLKVARAWARRPSP